MRVVVSSHVCGSKALSSIVVDPFASMLTERLRSELESPVICQRLVETALVMPSDEELRMATCQTSPSMLS